MQGKPWGIGAAEGSSETPHILFRARMHRGDKEAVTINKKQTASAVPIP